MILQTETATRHSIETTARATKPVALLACLSALALLWFELCHALSSEWRLNEQYNYGWFVPAFAAYLFWLRWQDRPTEAAESKAQAGKWLALALVAGALLLVFPIRLFEVANPDWRRLLWLHSAVAVTITLTLIWWVGGAKWLRHFCFPVAFIFVAVPWISAIEVPVIQGLMRSIAGVAAEILSLFGVPAQVQGNLIRLPSGVVDVDQACSGVRSLQTSLMVGLLFGELKRLNLSRRALLVIAAVAIALAANFFRAVFLVSIAAGQSLNAVHKWHDTAGYTILALVFIGTMLIAHLLGKREARETKAEPVPSTAWRPQLAPGAEMADRNPVFPAVTLSAGILLWLIAVEVGVEMWYRMHERGLATAPQWAVRWPASNAGFRELPIEEGVRATLRFDEGREVTWTNNGARYFLFFFRWNPGGSSVLRARAHRPDICLPAAGWQQRNDTTAVYHARNDLPLQFREVVFVQPNNNAIAHTFFCLQEDRRTREARFDLQLPAGVQPDWALPARWRAVCDGVRNMGQQVMEMIILSSPSSDEKVQAEFAAMLPNLIEVKNPK